MNTPAPTTDAPSATVDEALERLVAAHNQRIYELEKQRDELAACLREAKAGFVSGHFTTAFANTTEGVRRFTEFLTRINVALLRCDVRDRLDDRVAGQRKPMEAA